MTAESQLSLWAAGTDFVLDPESSPKREFARLAQACGLVGGDAEWNKRWLQIFGEEYGYIPKKHTPSPLPPVPKTANVIYRPKFAMSPDLETKQDFFRTCHAKKILPTQIEWCHRWHECFQEEWSMNGFGSYETAGPASELQQLCFGVFEVFTLDKHADVADEFNRLVKEKGWSHKQAKSQRQWCFGKSIGKKIHIIIDDDSCSDNSSNWETGSQIDTDSDWDFVSHAESHSGLSDCSIIGAEGGVVLNQIPNSATTLLNEFEQLAIRHANAGEARSKAPVSTPNKPEQPATQQNEAGKSKKQRRAQALGADFYTFFGSDLDGLDGWQKLCEIVGVSSDHKSVTQYKKALKTVHINLVNLVQHCRNPEATPLLKFASHKEFRDYTMQAKSRIFPKAAAKTNIFLKALLKQIF